VRHYARHLLKCIDTIPAAVMQALTHHPWPGNVPELQSVIERAVILSPAPTLRLAPDELPQRRPAEASSAQVRTLEHVPAAGVPFRAPMAMVPRHQGSHTGQSLWRL
jgi:DNA-binding NtrC family response regulator